MKKYWKKLSQLNRRAQKYERTKGVEKLVNSIKSCNKRLTKLQIIKYKDYMVKYPDNELLLSIKHLVPPHNVVLDTNKSNTQ